MSDPISWTEMARMPVTKMQDVLLARFIGRDTASKLGFTSVVVTRIATVISELTRNVVQHAGAAGYIQIDQNSGGNKLRITISDKGKGFDPSAYLGVNGTSAAGAGLSGTRNLVKAFDIQSTPGAGTTVTVEFWL